MKLYLLQKVNKVKKKLKNTCKIVQAIYYEDVTFLNTTYFYDLTH